ncbi:MAG: 6-bladed beta-propeller, partial [Candidatus Delongbacteria bacterium]|nr:6-bladed beta-propeller [Candidatus Delongbacteria bacterium]MCG2761339.1 6-bladed beta-propeller [Candidatus Delongbacteria bacterium]
MKFMNLLFALIIISACSDKKLNYTIEEVNGVKVYKNTNTPGNPNLKIISKELFTIKGYDDSFTGDSLRIIQDFNSVAVDSKENIYILSTNKATINKFDNNGNYIKTFGRMGDGPGESKWPQNMYIQNDTVNVLNQTVLQMNKFDTDGNFLFSVPTKECKMPVYTKPFGTNRLITYLCNRRYEEKGNFMDYDLGLVSSGYNIIKRLKKQSYEGKKLETEYYDMIFGFATNGKELFVADNSVDKYHIDAFDNEGNLLYSIEKLFRKIKASKETIDATNGKIQFIEAVIELIADNSGNLWSIVSEERN